MIEHIILGIALIVIVVLVAAVVFACNAMPTRFF